ncbi:MAG: TatD family hydrolase [Saprospiraceae bacterium]|jgi:TatD DNase family protein|nr:TatD family hydrolase [Saprospiraceae bacterium]MBP9210481.1 TatD family hydrolase [Saprospiraceae bacterium]
MQFIDTHAHLFVDAFDADRDLVIERARQVNVYKIVLPNINADTLTPMLDCCARHPGTCYAAIGLHPCDVTPDFRTHLDPMEALAADPRCAAIGETGTDAYWDTTHLEEQERAFRQQLQWAKTYDKPVIIHSRESLSRNLEIVASEQDGTLRGVFHCFGGTAEDALRIADLGFMMGIGGTITYKNNPLSRILSSIGLQHLVLETDSPYLSPVPHRGKRNEPSHLPAIATFLAQCTGHSLEELAAITTQNAQTLFKL